MKQKSALSSAAKRQGQDLRRRRLTKSNSKENNKEKAKRPELEEKLAEWITEQHDKHRYIIDYRAYMIRLRFRVVTVIFAVIWPIGHVNEYPLMH